MQLDGSPLKKYSSNSRLKLSIIVLFGLTGLLWCLLFPVAKAPSNIAAGLLLLACLLAIASGICPRISVFKEKTTIASMLLMFMPAIWFLHPGPGPFGAYLKDTVFGLFMLAMLFWVKNHNEKLESAIKALLFATTVTATISLVQHFGLLPQKESGVSLGLHNGTLSGAFSLLLVFAISLQTYVIRSSDNVREKCMTAAGLLICIADLLLVVPGRTGYLAFGVMSFFMLYNLFRFNKYAALAFVLSCTLFATNSNVLKSRLSAVTSNLQSYNQGDVVTSAGSRFEMWKVSWRNFTENPLIGAGTNGFSPRWMKEGYSRVPYAYNNPHSTYFHIMGNYGLVGLGILFLFIWCMAISTWRMRGTLAGTTTGSFLAIFLIGSLTNTMLTGDFYLTWLAIVSSIASGFSNVETPLIRESV